MKKITLFAFLAVPLFSLQMRGQDLQTRNKVIASYDIEKSSSIIKDFSAKALESRMKAYKVAEKLGIETSGRDNNGNYYELDYIDENGVLFYRSLYGVGSRLTARVDEVRVDNKKDLLLEGEGMIVGVIDGMSALGSHQDFIVSPLNRESRVFQMDIIPKIPSYGEPRIDHNDNRSHATHVVGIITAGGFYKGGQAKGIVPKAEVHSYDWYNDLNKMDKMAAAGILVSNHSYGMSLFDKNKKLRSESHRAIFGKYTRDSRNFDMISNEYPYYLPVTAAGNDAELQAYVYGNYPSKKNVDMLSGTSTAKNVVVVAAVEEVEMYQGPASVKMSVFSSQGPTDDFRIKPDISAKGVRVYSTIYRNPRESSNNEISNSEYNYMNGTSMAAPAVTGVFAMWQEWAIKYSEAKAPYKASTIRALMAHTADEAGSAPGPDHLFGWGLLNAKAGIQVLEGARNKGEAFIEERVLEQGELYKFEIKVEEKKSKMVVTLVWNDPAAQVASSRMDDSAPVLVNDLDVVVKNGTKSYFPWRFTKSFVNVRAEKGDNDVDNIEKIELFDVEPGVYEVIVSHKETLLNSKAQEYSLITTLGEFEDLKSLEVEEEKEEEKGEEKGEEKVGEEPSIVESESFGIWPNPVSNEMYVNLGSRYIDNNASIRVFDIDGRLVRDFKGIVGADGKIAVNMASLTAGSYFVEVKTGKFKKKVRIMKR